MQTKLDIHGIAILIDSDEEIAKWLVHDYKNYITDKIDKPHLRFNLFLKNFDYQNLPKMVATNYHDDYIIYDSNNFRIIDFLGQALSFYKVKDKIIDIYCDNQDQLYEIFCLSFGSLVGEELDKKSFHRLHCLALEKDNQATVLLLPPGAGKTTLALKFLNHNRINILSEDILLFKNGRFHNLNFRWGTRDMSWSDHGRLIKKEKHHNKILLNSKDFNISETAKLGSLILGRKTLSSENEIKKVSKFKLLMPLIKSMVLGLELQQSLAYFLLRNYKDKFDKFGIGLSRLLALFSVLLRSQTYEFRFSGDIEENYKELEKFIMK